MLALSRSLQQVPGLLLPLSPSHPARKEAWDCVGIGVISALVRCDLWIEQVEQAANTGYLDYTEGFVVCHVDWAVWRFRYTEQFYHVYLMYFFFLQITGLLSRHKLSVIKYFFFSK